LTNELRRNTLDLISTWLEYYAIVDVYEVVPYFRCISLGQDLTVGAGFLDPPREVTTVCKIVMDIDRFTLPLFSANSLLGVLAGSVGPELIFPALSQAPDI